MNDNDDGRALVRVVFGVRGSSGVNAGRAVNGVQSRIRFQSDGWLSRLSFDCQLRFAVARSFCSGTGKA